MTNRQRKKEFLVALQPFDPIHDLKFEADIFVQRRSSHSAAGSIDFGDCICLWFFQSSAHAAISK